jgi:hypothetical protein
MTAFEYLKYNFDFDFFRGVMLEKPGSYLK